MPMVYILTIFFLFPTDCRIRKWYILTDSSSCKLLISKY